MKLAQKPPFDDQLQPEEAGVDNLGIQCKGRALVKRLTENPRGAPGIHGYIEPNVPHHHSPPNSMLVLHNETIQDVMCRWKDQVSGHQRRLKQQRRGNRWDR